MPNALKLLPPFIVHIYMCNVNIPYISKYCLMDLCTEGRHVERMDKYSWVKK